MEYPPLLFCWSLDITSHYVQAAHTRVNLKWGQNTVTARVRRIFCLGTQNPQLPCGTAALSYSNKEKGDGFIFYTGIWGFVSHQCSLALCWVCCARLGHLRVRCKGTACSSSSLEWRWWDFPRSWASTSTQMCRQEGNRKQCLEADVFPSPPLRSHRLHSRTDPSATIQVYVHGIS